MLPEFIVGYRVVIFLMLLGFVLHFLPNDISQVVEQRVVNMSLIGKAACIVAVIVIVIQVKSAVVQPFIYFQF